MKSLKIVLTVLVFGLWSLVFVFSSSANSFFNRLPDDLKAENQKPSADKSARELYAQNCARCHGTDGRGDTELGRTFDVPNIADGKWQNKHSDAKISRKISRGGGGMPAFARKLSAKEIASLVSHVRSLKN
ncbi:MAG: cytochrome c [Pyrinomonadaceae bacterium]